MNTISKSISVLALTALSLAALAQDATSPTPPAGGPDHARMVPPIFAALDTNHDGVIDAAEIANASNALRALDKNGDGQLTRDEVQPARPEGGRGPGRSGGPGGARRPGGPQGEGRPHRPAPTPPAE